MQLSNWQRFGLALSFVWAVVAAKTSYADGEAQATRMAQWSFDACSTTREADLKTCESQREQTLRIWTATIPQNAALTALLPLPAAWIAGVVLVFGWRIQAAGWRACVPWARLGFAGRALVVVCVGSSVLATAFGAISAMNMHADAAVPVILSPLDVEVQNDGRGWVRVKGTWTRHGAGKGSAMGDPLQTSTMDCYRTAMRCFEARAAVGERVLQADLIEREVTSWTSAAIVMTEAALCAEQVYTIDLNTRAVTGSGRRINAGDAICKLGLPSQDETEWTLRMEKGFPVYWDLRREARPFALRAMQALTGD